MTMTYSKQNRFSATCGDAASSRAFAYILLILGTVLAVSLFIILLTAVPAFFVLPVLVGLIILVVRAWLSPSRRQGSL